MKHFVTGSCIALLGLALTACFGGSNGNGNGDSIGNGDATAEQRAPGIEGPQAPSIEGPVDISGFTRPQPGASLRFELQGELSRGARSLPVNATLTYVTRQPEPFQGQTAIPTELSVTWRVPSEGSEFTTGGTAYLTPDGQRIASVRHDGVTCLRSEGSGLRTQTQIADGDSSPGFREHCTDGSSRLQRWSVSSGEGTLDIAVTIQTTQAGTRTSEVETYRFDENGTPQSLKVEGTIWQLGIQTHVLLEGPAVSVNL